MGDPRHSNTDRHDVHQDRSLGRVHSALVLRLGLAVLGFLASVAGLVVATVVSPHLGWAVFFGVMVVVTALNIAVVSVRVAQRRRYRRAASGRTGSEHSGSGRKV